MSGSPDIFGNGNWSCTEGNWYTATTTSADLLSDIEDGPVDPYVMIYGGAQALPVAADGKPWNFTATHSVELEAIYSYFDRADPIGVYIQMGISIDGIFGLTYIHEWSLGASGGGLTGQESALEVNFLGDFSDWVNPVEMPPNPSPKRVTLALAYDRGTDTITVSVTHTDMSGSVVTSTQTMSGLTGTATEGTYPGWACRIGRYWPEQSPYYGIKVDTPIALVSQPSLVYTEPSAGAACVTVTPSSWAPAPETGTVFQVSPEFGTATDFVVLVETDCDVGCGDVCGGAEPGSLDCRQLSIETCGPAPC